MIITQPKEEIAYFVSSIIDCPNYWGEYTALAQVDKKGIVVGLLYNNFSPGESGIIDCQMHVAARTGAKWAKPEFLYHIFNYPFSQMGCKRVTAIVKKKHKKYINFYKKLGFEQEGVLRSFFLDGDAVILGMLKSECKWLDLDITKCYKDV